ncbi:hypothetical protein F4777DRAFT_550535 [Nemania sp. FL0916]|nr:hypothetical protein F4777DRAFT_550535 [Nemania sp. FL0916]
MPRKVRVPADPAENRESQQRSRARRKEYVASLEARVRDFASRAAQATLEMQRAAREVAWTNERLVELLATKGVSKGEVDEFLTRCREQKDCDVGTGSQVHGTAQGFELSQDSLKDDTGAGLAGCVEESQARSEKCNSAQGVRIREGRQRSPCASSRNKAVAKPNTDMAMETSTDIGMGTGCSGWAVDEVEIHICDGTSRPAKESAGTDEGSRALITSCDAAASIIADFQGHGDVSHARKALGCGDATNCHVRNTRLFQLMDETGCS